MLIISKQEAETLRDSLARLLQLKGNDKRILVKNAEGLVTFEASREATTQVVSILSSEPIGSERFILELSRRSLRLIEKYIKHELFYLAGTTIPQYQERISKAKPEQKLGLTKYLNAATIRLDMWTDVLRRVQKELITR